MNTTSNPTPTIKRHPFDLGNVVATRGVAETIPRMDCKNALMRHAGCDWGDCGPENWVLNDLAVVEDDRLHSVYQDCNGVTFWIITEWDRGVTTLLLPDEY